MEIFVDEFYNAVPRGNFIGVAGEHMSRQITVVQPEIEGAEYILRISYSDGVCYDLPIEGGKVSLTRSAMRGDDNAKAQWIAVKRDGEGSSFIAKSEQFPVRIGASDDGESLPTHEEILSVRDEIFAARDEVIGAIGGINTILAEIVGGEENADDEGVS